MTLLFLQKILLLIRRKSLDLLKRLKAQVDFTRMHTWGVFILTLLFFSLQLIVRHYDRAEVTNTQVKVQSVEKRMDSLAIVQKVSDQMKNQEIKRIQRENKQLEEIVVNHDVFIQELKKDIVKLRQNEKDALHRIENMSDEELIRYFKSLDKLDNPR